MNAFTALGVDVPLEWDVGGEERREREMLEDMEKGLSRSRGDYTSEEVYEALRVQREEDLVNFSDPHAGEPSGGQHIPEEMFAGGSLPTYEEAQNSSSSTSYHPPATYPLSDNKSSYPLDTKTSYPLDTKMDPTSFLPTLHTTINATLATLLLSHIRPAIQTQARAGMFKGTFILVPLSQLTDPHAPHNSYNHHLNFTKDPPRDHEIVTSFEDEADYRRIIFLPSEEGYELGFLVQEVVMGEVRSQLLEALGGREEVVQPVTPKPAAPPPEQQVGKRKGWFGNGKRKGVVPVVPVVEEVKVVSRVRGVLGGKVKVVVRPEEVWVRRESDMGLLETVQGRGVVVGVEVVV